MRKFLGLVAMLAVLLPAAAHAADGKTMAAVQEELSGIEVAPNLDRLKAVPGAEEALRELAADGRSPVMTRAKAVAALRAFPTDATLTFLTATLDDVKAPESLRVRAPLAIAQAFPDKALGALKGRLADENVSVRKAVAEGLGKVGTPEAIAALKERKALELAPVVKKTIEELTAGR